MPELNIKPIPQRLRSLNSAELVPLQDSNGDYLVITKQETNEIIKELIEVHSEIHLKKAITNVSKKFDDFVAREINPLISKEIQTLQKEVAAYLEFRIDNLANNICETLITKKFNEEVERRVSEKIKEIKGKF